MDAQDRAAVCGDWRELRPRAAALVAHAFDLVFCARPELRLLAPVDRAAPCLLALTLFDDVVAALDDQDAVERILDAVGDALQPYNLVSADLLALKDAFLTALASTYGGQWCEGQARAWALVLDWAFTRLAQSSAGRAAAA